MLVDTWHLEASHVMQIPVTDNASETYFSEMHAYFPHFNFSLFQVICHSSRPHVAYKEGQSQNPHSGLIQNLYPLSNLNFSIILWSFVFLF